MTTQGTVKWFSPQKGFGFLVSDNPSEPDIFCHITAVERSGLSTISEGQRVEFDVVPDRKRPHKLVAENIRVVP
jgi:cold shock protein